MVCSECVTNFFMEPWKLSLVIISLILSITSLIYFIKNKSLSNNKKLALIYSHVFFLAFPIIFYVFYKGCSTLFAGCNKMIPIFVMIGLTTIVSLVLGTLTGQLLFLRKIKKNSLNIKDNKIINFVKEYSNKLQIKMPKVYFVNSAKPFAFTYLKSKIFISIGMLEILEQKEIEAVLLHELNHVKNKSSILKFWTSLIKILSPIAAFSGIKQHTDLEEQKADNFAIKEQHTNTFINSAKEKLDQFFS